MHYDAIHNVNIFYSRNIYNKPQPSNLKLYFQIITTLKLWKYDLFMN